MTMVPTRVVLSTTDEIAEKWKIQSLVKQYSQQDLAIRQKWEMSK